MYLKRENVTRKRTIKVTTSYLKACRSFRIGLHRENKEIVLHIRPKMMSLRTFTNKYDKHFSPQRRQSLHRNCKCCQPFVPKTIMSGLLPPNLNLLDKSLETDDSSPQDEVDRIPRNHSFTHSGSQLESPTDSKRLSTSMPSPIEGQFGKENFADTLRIRNLMQERAQISHEERKQTYNYGSQKKSNDYNRYMYVFGPLGILLMAMLVYYFNPWHYWTEAEKNFDLREELAKLAERHGQTEDFSNRIEYSLMMTNRTEDVSVFLLVHNSNWKIETLSDEVAEIAGSYLGDASGSSPKPLKVGREEVDSADFLERYRPELRSSRVMVVNLNLITGQAAKPFHYYCDEYNPLVKKSAIFMILDGKYCKEQPTFYADQKSLIQTSEECLFHKWQDLPSEHLRPLVARVINVIIFVT